jgi:hypothetical protein
MQCVSNQLSVYLAEDDAALARIVAAFVVRRGNCGVLDYAVAPWTSLAELSVIAERVPENLADQVANRSHHNLSALTVTQVSALTHRLATGLRRVQPREVRGLVAESISQGWISRADVPQEVLETLVNSGALEAG